MSLRVIGAGVGRTGSTSLKLALEKLLGGRCYHMYEVFRHPHHVPIWHEAVRGRPPSDWDVIYGEFVAAVDWPTAAFWRPLMEAYPDALVILSLRTDAEEWFASAGSTIGKMMERRPERRLKQWHAMATDLLRTTFTSVPFEHDAATSAYERHNAAVRDGVPAARLLEWHVADGWAPLCERLRLPVPDEPFPRTNTKDEFLAFLDGIDERRSWRRRFRRR